MTSEGSSKLVRMLRLSRVAPISFPEPPSAHALVSNSEELMAPNVLHISNIQTEV